MKVRKRSKSKGYSLIELVAALTIFSLGVMGALTLFSTCLRSTADSLSYTQAVLLAQGTLEETVAEGDLLAGSDSGDFGDAYPRHSWEVEIEDTDQTGLMQMQVTVTWIERGRERQYALATLVAER